MKNGKLTETKINTHIQELSEEENILLMRKEELEKEIERKRFQKQSLEKKKAHIQSKEPTISDHAIIRYFERIEGYDIEEIKRKILSPKVIQQIDTLGSKGVYATDDFYVLVKNRTVVTVYKGK